MQIDQSNPIGSRTVYAYFPNYPYGEVTFRFNKGERHPIRIAIATEFVLRLDSGGRGSIQLPAPQSSYFPYTVIAPDKEAATGGLTYSDGSISLYSWLGLGADDYVTNPVLLEEGAAVRIYGRNVSGDTLTPGTAIKLDSSDSLNATFDLAQADSVDNARVIGIASEDIADNEKGWITVFGKISNIDTHALSEGFRVYLSPDTAGQITTAKPSAPNMAVEVAFVSRSDSFSGELFVNVNTDEPVSPFTAFARSLVAAVDKAAARAVLDVPETGDVPTALTDLDTSVTGAELDADHATIGGLGTMATQDDTAVDINGGTIIDTQIINCEIVSLEVPLDVSDGGTGASDEATARANLGAAAAADIPTELADLDTSVTGAELDADHATIGGLGTMATQDTDDYVAAGGDTMTGKLTISETRTDTAAGDVELQRTSATLNPGSASSTTFSNVYSQIYVPSSNGQNFTGKIAAMRFLSIFDGSGTCAALYGIRGEAWAQASSTVTTLYAMWAQLKIESAATYGYGLFVESPAGTGTVTLTYGARIANMGRSGVAVAYGLYINSQSGAASNNYAIYTNGGKNQLGDQLKIDGSQNTIQQIVQGHSTQTANLTEWQNSAASVLSSIDPTGAFNPPSMADSAAANNSIYYSTDASKLVYKDPGGSVNNLY